MTNPKKEMNKLFIFKIENGERILNEKKLMETIYGVEESYFGKYFCTIATDDLQFPILKTYFVKINEKGKSITEKIIEKKGDFLKNLEKATLSLIEKEIGLSVLAYQLN